MLKMYRQKTTFPLLILFFIFLASVPLVTNKRISFDTDILEHMIENEMRDDGDEYSRPRHKRSGLKDVEKTDPIETKELPGGYIIYRKRVNWKEAHLICEEKVGHLASPTDLQGAKSLIEEIFKISEFSQDYDWGRTTSEFGLDRRYWIGLTDIVEEGVWSWAGKGKKLTYHDLWYPNQPDHVNKDGSPRSGRLQHCGNLWNPAYWKLVNGQKSQRHSFDDLECEWTTYFICEKDEAKMEKLRKAKEANVKPAPPPGPSPSPGPGHPPPPPPPTPPEPPAPPPDP